MKFFKSFGEDVRSVVHMTEGKYCTTELLFMTGSFDIRIQKIGHDDHCCVIVPTIARM